YLRNPPATQDDSRAPRNEAVHGAPGFFPSTVSQNPPRPVSRPARRTDKEVEPLRGGRRLREPTDPTSAPNSSDRRECHVVTPWFLQRGRGAGLGGVVMVKLVSQYSTTEPGTPASHPSDAVIFETVRTDGLAHLSYLIGDRSAGQAVVIDPR